MSVPTARELLDWARSDEQELVSRVERVLAIHRRREITWPSGVREEQCGHCFTAWPCLTVLALDGEDA